MTEERQPRWLGIQESTTNSHFGGGETYIETDEDKPAVSLVQSRHKMDGPGSERCRVVGWEEKYGLNRMRNNARESRRRCFWDDLSIPNSRGIVPLYYEKCGEFSAPKVTVVVGERKGRPKNLFVLTAGKRCFFGGVLPCPARVVWLVRWHNNNSFCVLATQCVLSKPSPSNEFHC